MTTTPLFKLLLALLWIAALGHTSPTSRSVRRRSHYLRQREIELNITRHHHHVSVHHGDEKRAVLVDERLKHRDGFHFGSAGALPEVGGIRSREQALNRRDRAEVQAGAEAGAEAGADADA
ncbi:hypothetical protein P8C59_005822 [Phyllachora maydis]|uniref:Secreted protein n=1 Tax=Phyllachora maydis TaxID=1825666 RepID=A0AAD9I673_9PEZI|nr:hypothetical protein P8C59_005822 [Phyllachora maydis]